MNFGLSALAGIVVVEYLLNTVLGYYSIFLICASMSGLSLIILWGFFDEKPLNELYLETKHDRFEDQELTTDHNSKDKTSLVSKE